MSRIRVGDTEIDGNNIRSGGASTSGVSRSRVGSVGLHRRSAPPTGAAFRLAAALPVSAGFLNGTGVAVASMGIVGLFVSCGSLSPVTFLTRGAVLIPLGVGISVLGVLKEFAQRRVLPRPAQRAEPATEDPNQTLTRLLATANRAHTVEWIVARLGWHHDDVVRALAKLRDSGGITEELDPATGEFFYVSAAPPSSTHSR